MIWSFCKKGVKKVIIRSFSQNVSVKWMFFLSNSCYTYPFIHDILARWAKSVWKSFGSLPHSLPAWNSHRCSLTSYCCWIKKNHCWYLKDFMRLFVYFLSAICCNQWRHRRVFCFVQCRGSRMTSVVKNELYWIDLIFLHLYLMIQETVVYYIFYYWLWTFLSCKGLGWLRCRIWVCLAMLFQNPY